MRRAWVVCGLVLVLGQTVTTAQEPAGSGALAAPSAAAPPAPRQDQDEATIESLFTVGSSEWMITGGPAYGVEVFHSAPGHRYLLTSLSWGRILTRPLGPGVLRGRFEWAIEAIPLFAQFSPDDTLGAGVTPLTWRWNFDPYDRLVPFAELAGGLLFTRDPVPTALAKVNFTAHASFGVRYFVRPRRAFVASYVFHHISNGNRLDRNPGVNAHLVQVGLSVLRPR